MLLRCFFGGFFVNCLKHKLDFILILLKLTQFYLFLKYGGAAACEKLRIILNLTEFELMSVLLQVGLQSSILLNLKCHFLRFDKWF